MLGLFRNDVFIIKKQLIITSVTAAMIIAFGVIFCESFRYGNLAKLPPEEFDSTFYAMTMIFGPVSGILLSIHQPFKSTNYINRQSGWFRFTYTTPISESRIALTNLLEAVGFSLFSFIFGTISTASCYGIAGREITPNDFFIMTAGILFITFLALLPTGYILKSRGGEAILDILICFASSGAAVLGALCYSNGNPQRLINLTEKLSENAGVICLILAVADIAVFFISWAAATHILKKRKF